MSETKTTEAPPPEAPSIITNIVSSLRGDRLLVAEQKTAGDREIYYPVRFVVDTAEARDTANKVFQDLKRCPYGGRLRPVTDTAEAARLAKELPRPLIRFNVPTQDNAAAAREGGSDDEAAFRLGGAW